MIRVRLEFIPSLAESLGIEPKLEEIFPSDGTAKTLGNLLDRLCLKYRLIGKIVADIRNYQLTDRVTIFLNWRFIDTQKGLNTELADGDTLTFVQLIEGG